MGTAKLTIMEENSFSGQPGQDDFGKQKGDEVDNSYDKHLA